MIRLGRYLDGFQRMAAKSPALVRLAVLIRNQCRCVIKYHLAESPDTLQTGEAWLGSATARIGAYFIDVGANVGDWSSNVLSEAGPDVRLTAYEPSRSALAKLRERFESEARVTVVGSALADVSGTATFFEEAEAGKGSSFVPGFTKIQGHDETVEVRTLDAELDRLGWPQVDFLKIDAEGYDFRVLSGAAQALERHAIKMLQFEYNRSWQLAGDTLHRAITFLERFGYAVFLLKRDGLYTLNYKLYEEYFEYSNFVAISPEMTPFMQQYFRGTI